MKRSNFVMFGLAVILFAILVPAWAISREGTEEATPQSVDTELERGKDLFVTNCGSCHTLAAAGTEGVVGPNLDDILVPTGSNDPAQFEQLYTRVLQAVTCGVPPGGGRMPEGILIDREAQEVSVFVAAYAGQIGKGATLETESAPRAEPPDDC